MLYYLISFSPPDTLDLKAMCGSPAKPQLKKHGYSSSSGARLKYSSCSRTGTGDNKEDLSSALGLKDKAIFLFQSVGKILHFKSKYHVCARLITKKGVEMWSRVTQEKAH